MNPKGLSSPSQPTLAWSNTGEGTTCYDEISKFLSHCADQRFERSKSWDTDAIFLELHPLLGEFEAMFAGVYAAKRRRQEATLEGLQHTTSLHIILFAETETKNHVKNDTDPHTSQQVRHRPRQRFKSNNRGERSWR